MNFQLVQVNNSSSQITNSAPQTNSPSQYNVYTIVDAKDCGLHWQDVYYSILEISNRELSGPGEQGCISPESYINPSYFEDKTFEPGICSPETIFVAKIANKIIGFIISDNDEVYTNTSDYEDKDICFVSYMAVDSAYKKQGVGTKLMLAMMEKAKGLGKRYLTLTYVPEGAGIDKNRGQARKDFYNSFKTKFEIPIKEIGNGWTSRQLHVKPYFDLQGFHPFHG